MLVFVANVSCVYPLEAIVIMSSASQHAKRTSINNQTKPSYFVEHFGKHIFNQVRTETMHEKTYPQKQVTGGTGTPPPPPSSDTVTTFALFLILRLPYVLSRKPTSQRPDRSHVLLNYLRVSKPA